MAFSQHFEAPATPKDTQRYAVTHHGIQPVISDRVRPQHNDAAAAIDGGRFASARNVTCERVELTDTLVLGATSRKSHPRTVPRRPTDGCLFAIRCRLLEYASQETRHPIFSHDPPFRVPP